MKLEFLDCNQQQDGVMCGIVNSVKMDPFERLRSAFSNFNDEQMQALVNSIEETVSSMNQSEASISSPSTSAAVGNIGKKNSKLRKK